MIGRIVVLVALAVCSVSAQNWNENQGDNVIHGQWNEKSVLIYEGRLNGERDFEWQGNNLISRYEVRAENNPNAQLWSLNFLGGLNEDYLQFWSDNQELHLLVRIFSEPQNQTLGWQQFDSVLVHTRRITGVAPLTVNITGAFIATYAELVDLTNGTGVRVTDRGLHGSNVELRFRSDLFRGQVDFNVNVYGELVTPNHHEIGNITAQSVQISSQVIVEANLTRWGSISIALPNHDFDYARLTDLTDGTGGRVSSATHFGDTLDINFDSRSNLRFLLEIYGTPANSSDITVGELQPGSVLLAEENVWEWSRQTTVILRTDHPIDRIEVRNQERRSRVRSTLVTGAVGGQTVAVLLESDEPVFMQFSVRAFGRRSRGAGNLGKWW